jgi:hypothetical protein
MPKAPATYHPRSCDCQFCSSHGALYASDSKGTLKIKIKSVSKVNKYRMGSRIADFMICKDCGVMTHVCYEENGSFYGSINVRSANDFACFGGAHVTHLIGLSDQERINRWKAFWFQNVEILIEGA